MAGVLGLSGLWALADEPAHALSILDAHLHVWDLKQFHLPWLDRHVDLLSRDYSVADYGRATVGLNVTSAIYVEVNVEPGQRTREAEFVVQLSKQKDNLISGGVIAGDPRNAGFEEYLGRFKDSSAIKGVRFYYPLGGSSDAAFLKGLRLMGDWRMSFELQLGADSLIDASEAAKACPQTSFVLNHCGSASPRLFRKDAETDTEAGKQRELWRNGMDALAKQPNVVCKISGIADEALPGDATAADVAPIVDFCFDAFGPDRVLFGGNWPVCLKGSTFRHWVEALRQVVSGRSEPDRRKLFFSNAARVYRIPDSEK